MDTVRRAAAALGVPKPLNKPLTVAEATQGKVCRFCGRSRYEDKKTQPEICRLDFVHAESAHACCLMVHCGQAVHYYKYETPVGLFYTHNVGFMQEHPAAGTFSCWWNGGGMGDLPKGTTAEQALLHLRARILDMLKEKREEARLRLAALEKAFNVLNYDPDGLALYRVWPEKKEKP